MGCIDLLVQKRDLSKADELLRRMEFVRKSPAVLESKLELDARHDIRYVRPERFPPAEIRHHILNRKSDAAMFARIPIEDFWKRSQSVRIESAETLVFSHEDLLLHFALHLSKCKRFLGQLRTLCDIREVCKRYASTIDWGRLITHAENYKVSKCVYYPLRLARDLLGAGGPSLVLADLRVGFGQLPLEGRFISGFARRAILS